MYTRAAGPSTTPRPCLITTLTTPNKTGRGLVHAYWAPNVYAFYCLTDLLLGAFGRRLHYLPPRPAGKANWASGLVQVVEPEVLPSFTPLMTAVLTLGSMAPALWRLWTPAAKGGQQGAVKRWVGLRLGKRRVEFL